MLKSDRLILYNIPLVITFFLLILFQPNNTRAQTLPSQEKDKNIPLKTVAFLYDGNSKELTREFNLIKKELTKLAEDRYSLRFTDEAFGGYNPAIIRQKLDEFLQDDDIGLIIGLGLMASFVVLETTDLCKPVILGYIYDINIVTMPFKDGTSGRKNLCYLASKRRLQDDINLFRKIVPFKKLHVLIDGTYLEILNKIISRATDIDTKMVLVDYKKTAKDTLDALTAGGKRVGAVYLGPSNLLYGQYREEIIEGLNARKIPTFCSLRYDAIQGGVLAGLIPKSYTKFARRVALDADRIFRGEKAEEIPVIFKIEEKLVINARTARQIGASPPLDVLLDSEVLYPFEGWGSQLTIIDAVESARQNNLLFRIKDEAIEEARKEHLLQWSNYLPSIKYSLQYEMNDSESARNSGGLTPKLYLQNRFILKQLIFSDPILTDIINSKKQIGVEELQRDSETLDITDETSRAYLQYLIAKALCKVSLQDLRATRQDLRVAIIRFDTGIGAKEETLRWRSELADRKAQLIKNVSNMRKVKVSLNQLMNHPQEEPFIEEDVGLELTKYYLGGNELQAFVENEEMLAIFIDFMVKCAMENSPHIQALDIGISQQRNVKNTAVKKFFLPEAHVVANRDHELDSKYLGTTPVNDKDKWFVGASLSYPIFEGGAKWFNYGKQKAELERLIFKKSLSEQYTELDVRKAAYQIFFSFPNIALSHTSMVNSTKNYEILQKKYAKGTASITDLVDAQRDKFTRESDAVIAIYNFLQNLATLDRAISRFQFFSTGKERKVWLEEMKSYFAKRGVSVDLGNNQ